MKPIPTGIAGSYSLLVTPEVAIDFLASDEARVLATPFLIGYMELTARNAIRPFLDDNEDSVGTTVNIRHLAATPVGMSVHFKAEVTAVEGRRVAFRVEARDETELIGEGTHERFVIDVPRFVAKLAAKRAGQ
ncbi:MAG: thioesterase family protein [Bryobacteraceae bacterium]|nr:thioesterase family protein [Bryobacteraceae bacterium]